MLRTKDDFMKQVDNIFLFIKKNILSTIKTGNRYCCYCHQKSLAFLPYAGGSKKLPHLMKTLNIIGSDIDNFNCPKCGSHDRERHLKLYFDTMNLKEKITNKNILHFAPERWFSTYIASANPSNYTKADLFPNAPDVQKVDMLATNFANEQFDFIIANHVLEHVDDISKALTELHRILKPGGLAVFQTPYSSILCKTFEDPGITTKEARLQAYGQKDHVRLFGNNIFNIIESFGFKTLVKSHKEVLSNVDPAYNGCNIEEPIFLFEKEGIFQ